MKFIVDAQLPRLLARSIIELGDDAVHTLDLPDGNLTTDSQIIQLAVRDGAVVITKDQDFVDSFLLRGEPPKLLHITTGNIPNAQLMGLIETHWLQIRTMFTQGNYLEMNRAALTLHM
jgi:predicted nuclease of predicted toxin-antitoxin system